ncbi:MAG: bifunctional DNA-formamidopyrimidine glycosylase/DNA-(apurinic or apyrimidinic site) lyase [Rubrivivax sp.]|jgi:formamidopyrimidine-DNA glycosylase|nr:bifunctional DNA-formamidopyrimidine glycosylase/DNA-(apurinic or apyrimidinic site) lyase [Rubrivivax sp.]
MPELPEVEVTRRSVAAAVEGACITAAALGKPLRWPLGCDPDELMGRTIGALVRRGKYIWMPLSAPADRAPAGPGGLLWHLGMSGSLGWHARLPEAGPHDHFDLHTTRGALRLHDPRRFGAVVWAAGLDHEPAATLLSRLGPEPFDATLTPERFWQSLRRRRVAIKPLLLSGDIVVGAGNIYACEALFHAGIDPRLRADRISRARAERLLAEVRATLARALALGGSTLRDFKDAHGMDGAYQGQAAVYGREGQECLRCARPVRRMVQGQRSTFYCAACQRR